MFPIGALASLVVLNTLSGGLTGVIPDDATFKKNIFLLLLCKCIASFVCCVLAFLFMDDNRALPNSFVLHEESRRLGICTQMKLLMTDKVYLLFVYGPMISISLLGASNNHLGSLLVAFSLSIVKSFKYYLSNSLETSLDH